MSLLSISVQPTGGTQQSLYDLKECHVQLNFNGNLFSYVVYTPGKTFRDYMKMNTSGGVDFILEEDKEM